jgi:hypothetical protein
MYLLVDGLDFYDSRADLVIDRSRSQADRLGRRAGLGLGPLSPP